MKKNGFLFGVFILLIMLMVLYLNILSLQDTITFNDEIINKEDILSIEYVYHDFGLHLASDEDLFKINNIKINPNRLVLNDLEYDYDKTIWNNLIDKISENESIFKNDNIYCADGYREDLTFYLKDNKSYSLSKNCSEDRNFRETISLLKSSITKEINDDYIKNKKKEYYDKVNVLPIDEIVINTSWDKDNISSINITINEKEINLSSISSNMSSKSFNKKIMIDESTWNELITFIETPQESDKQIKTSVQLQRGNYRYYIASLHEYYAEEEDILSKVIEILGDDFNNYLAEAIEH